MSTIKQNDINEDSPTAKTAQHTADAEGKPAASVEFSPSPADERRIANKLAAVGVTGNIALSAFKLFAGIFGNSAAMVSDAVHSLSDVAATAIAFVGVRLSQRAADESHPYGHERFECLASMALGLILAATGAGIGFASVESIVTGAYKTAAAPGWLALSAAIVSIVVKEGMFWYTRHWARVMNSDAFMADAWHHRSDALSSIGALVGIGGAMLGWGVCDPLASAVICLIIFKVAYEVLRDAVNKVTDTPTASWRSPASCASTTCARASSAARYTWTRKSPWTGSCAWWTRTPSPRPRTMPSSARSPPSSTS